MGCHGAFMVLSWRFHGTSMVLSWTLVEFSCRLCGALMGLSCEVHGGACAFMAPSWWFYGSSPWIVHGASMVLSLVIHELSWYFVVLSRCFFMAFRGLSWAFMVLPWRFHYAFTVFFRRFHGVFMVLSLNCLMVLWWTLMALWWCFHDLSWLSCRFQVAFEGFNGTFMVFSWMFHESFMGLSWCCHGTFKALSRSFIVISWPPMLSWRLHGLPCLSRRFHCSFVDFCDTCMGFHDSFMVRSLDFRGLPPLTSMGFDGALKVLSYDSALMVLWWCFDSALMVRWWCFHGYAWACMSVTFVVWYFHGSSMMENRGAFMVKSWPLAALMALSWKVL